METNTPTNIAQVKKGMNDAVSGLQKRQAIAGSFFQAFQKETQELRPTKVQSTAPQISLQVQLHPLEHTIGEFRKIGVLMQHCMQVITERLTPGEKSASNNS